jgi:ATP-dependent exoDNAse (exonuclease V) alpha subunit
MNPKIKALIEEARAKAQARIASGQLAAPAAGVNTNTTIASPNTNLHLSNTPEHAQQTKGITFNSEQKQAIELALQGKSFCLIGAAGTGKTTVTQEIIARLQQCSHVSPLEDATKHLAKDAPSIVICGFTNKAVNNIRKKLPKHLQSHCITIHKLIEYAPVYYEIIDDEGMAKTTMRFEPSRNAANPLPHISTIIFEESSMIGTDLYGEVMAALPNPARTQIIMLGDLNQIPPVFGPSILGFKLAELTTVELTQVYRQALASPIISLATAIRTDFGFMPDQSHPAYSVISRIAKSQLGADAEVIDCADDGILSLRPWKKRVAKESAIATMGAFLPKLIESKDYDPAEDMILCPFNKSFGTVELNKYIADYLAKKRGDTVYEVIARYQKTYWAVGDRVMVDRHEAFITKIEKTIGYGGKLPRTESKTLDRWGTDPESDQPESKLTADEILNGLDGLSSDEEGSKNLASHTITVDIPDTGETRKLSTAGEINSMIFGYVLTVHKSQGSEWQKVFILLHDSHATMLSRELLYTAVTRAKHHLYIICEGDTAGRKNQILRAAERPIIPGTSLAQKIEWFKGKGKELVSITDTQ